MSYDTARLALAALLGGAAITSPITQTVARVYSDPPSTIQDLPCLILYGASGADDWQAHGVTSIREENTERVRLLIHDADLDRAANIVRAYKTAVRALIRATPTLGGDARISRVAWEEPASFRYGGREDLVGMDFLVTFTVLTP